MEGWRAPDQVGSLVAASDLQTVNAILSHLCVHRRIMRNLSLPVVWEDADMPEEWERDASMIPDAISRGRYVFWGWKDAATEKQVLPFNGSIKDWPGLLNLTELQYKEVAAPEAMGMLFRDPSTYELFSQGNAPFKSHLESAGVAPTEQWPALVYGTLPSAWGVMQQDTLKPTFPNLEVM